LQSVILFILALFQLMIPSFIMVFSLALLSGYDLALFRFFHHTTINNGIMTGNTKDLMGNLYVAIFQKDAEARRDVRNIFLTILIFIFGVGAGTLLVVVNGMLNLWIAFGMMFVSMIWVTYLNKKYDV